MKTYIINLERSVDRREHIIREAERCGLDYTIVKAIDGGTVPEQEILEYADTEIVSRHRSWLSNRALATALSHRNVFEKIIADEVEVALVLEDDVKLSESFTKIATEVANTLSEAEIALLHSVSFEPLRLSTINAMKISEHHKLMYPMFLNGVGSAAAYLITRQGAKNLFEKLIPLGTAPDSWNDFVEKGWLDRVRVLYPSAASVIGAKSTIYVGSQHWLRSRVTEFVDKHRIPIVYSYLRNQRLKNVEKMSQFVETETPSQFDRDQGLVSEK